jgi:hypothetical protein
MGLSFRLNGTESVQSKLYAHGVAPVGHANLIDVPHEGGGDVGNGVKIGLSGARGATLPWFRRQAGVGGVCGCLRLAQ